MTSGNPKASSGKGYEKRHLSAIAGRWDAKAADWDRNLEDPLCHLNEDNAYRRFLDEAKKVIDERRDFCSQNGLIDYACATGLVLQRLVPNFAWALGVDISPQMIRLAQAKQIPNATFVIGDCFQLAACAQPAGAVLSRGVLLSHYGHAHALPLLRSAKSVLVTGGFLFCDFLNKSSRTRYQHLAEDKTYFDSAEVVALALNAGFARAEVIGTEDRRILLLLAQINKLTQSVPAEKLERRTS